MSEEEREKRRILGLEQWEATTPEERQKHSEDGSYYAHKYWDNITSEEYLIHCKKVSDAKIESWSKIPFEERQKHLEPAHVGFQIWFNSLSEEEFRKYRNSISCGLVKRWEKIPIEERYEAMKLLFEGRNNYYDNLSDEEYKELCEFLAKISDDYRKNETAEQREQRIANLSNSLITYHLLLTYEEFIILEQNKAIKANDEYTDEKKEKLHGNELTFMKLLDSYGFDYRVRWHSTFMDKDFQKIFPYNPYLETDKISPFHEWDFLIKVKPFDIFVDIDGSIHSPNRTNGIITNRYGKKHDMFEYIRFNDSQRKYQTDNLPAYIVQCYNDKITDDTPIINVITHEKSLLRNFLNKIEKYKY